MPDPLSRQRRAIRFLPGLVTTGFVALIVGAIAVVWLQVKSQEYSGLVEHTLRVETQLARMTASVERLETVRRGFLMTGRANFVQRAEQIATELPPQLDALRAEIADNPDQRPRAELLTQLIAAQRDRLRAIWPMDATQRAALREILEEDPGVVILQRIRATSEAMQAEEQGLLADRSAGHETLIRAFYTVFTGVGLLLVAVGALTFVVLRRYTRELNGSHDALALLNEGLEGLVNERTSDLRRANDEIQRFAYIVSHDLRSPLVNVMGFTAELEAAGRSAERLIARIEEQAPELVDKEATVAVREDLPEAIGFIRSSTQKMDRLINAILKLSREGRRNLAVEPLDMDALVAGIFDSLHQRVQDAGAEVRAQALPAITSDRVAVEQILSNLVENAVKYLQPGRPGLIEVRGMRVGERVTFEVEDNGRGIDPKDHERVFDLFRRSGLQDRPGEGIGLAHVRALAYRLGGVIDVRSELGRGATFRLSLPARLILGEGNT